MRKFTLFMFLTAFVFSANAQLQINTAPFADANHRANAGIEVNTVRTITSEENPYITAPEVADIDITWYWTPFRAANVTWTLEGGGVGPRNLGEPTVVNSFYQWAGIPEADAGKYPNAVPAGDYLMPVQTVTTRDGFAVKIKSRDGHLQDAQTTGFSKTQSGFFSLAANMNAGADPIWFNSLEDMKTYVTSGKFVLSDRTYSKDMADGDGVPRSDYGALHEGLHTHTTNADFPDGLNTADSALVVVLPANGNEALAMYPGIFKEIDLRFSFRSDRQQWTRDIEFDVLTMDEGNTGKKSTWDIIVSLTYNNLSPNPERDVTDSVHLGETGAVLGGPLITDAATGVENGQVARRWKAGTYTSGDPVMHINVNEVMGLKPHELFNRTVVVALQTKGTEGDTDNASGTYDPVVGIDNIKWGGWNTQLDAALWAAATEPLLPVRDETSNPVIGISSTKVIGGIGVIRILDAESDAAVFSITGQMVATIAKGVSSVAVPAGIYIVRENGRLAAKVIVR
ncbi:MAG: T9SS type A sorting domain-containing protein [Tannerella sp.]|jgi:hypothetical protein|nr:T9SS type A sorting domain-containing protein [Tannerella sp.]